MTALSEWELAHGDAWLPARVPGTVAGALGVREDLDEHDWTFRCRFDAEPAADGERVELRFDGIATLAAVTLNGEPLLSSASMWERHAVDVSERLRAGAPNELQVVCHALAPVVRKPRKPRARWRTKLVAQGLRFQRTMLLGRAPGIAAAPAVVGPWRPVTLVRTTGVSVGDVALRARLEGSDGVLEIDVALDVVAPAQAPATLDAALDGPSGRHAARLEVSGGRARGELRVPGVERWWPHTHGEPVLHDVTAQLGETTHALGRVGFRSVADAGTDGLALRVNDVDVFARGAVWTPVDLVGMAPADAEVRATLTALRDAGLNLVRIVGTATYEDASFHDLCDELGLMVWQDLMLANLDYPFADEQFAATIAREVSEQIGVLAGRASLVVVCGGSEVEQQVAMLGLDPQLAREPHAHLRELVGAAGSDAVWVANGPSGGERPFTTDAGVANYFGVGGYQRPLSDVRAAGVRFASECLALANVPDEDVARDTGVPRDAGASWDFADVRDHYLAELYGADPVVLRRTDPDRYLELSRAVTGELMSEVFGEWRRARSPCAGAIVLWARDLEPGSGWGLLDHRGAPKPVAGALAGVLAPVALWTTDEGLNGIAVHVANDRPQALRGELDVALYADGQRVVERASLALDVPAHTTVEHGAEAVLGRFLDVNWSYRFGPPAHDTLAATLRDEQGELIAQALRFPHGRPLTALAPADLGLELRTDGSRLTVTTRRTLSGVRIHGARASAQSFDMAPGQRTIALRPLPGEDAIGHVALTALNVRGKLQA